MVVTVFEDVVTQRVHPFTPAALIGRIRRDDLAGMVNFFSVFADTCHHGKEEGMLFPAMEKVGVPREHGPIGVMLFEHELGRKYVRGMKDALAEVSKGSQASPAFVREARAYVNLLTAHIAKENQILFPMAEARLSEEVKSSLIEGFEQFEEETIGQFLRPLVQKICILLFVVPPPKVVKIPLVHIRPPLG